MKIPSDSILNVNLDLLRSGNRAGVLGENQPDQGAAFSEAATVERSKDYAPSDVDCGDKILGMENDHHFLLTNTQLIKADTAFQGEYSSKVAALFILEPLGL